MAKSKTFESNHDGPITVSVPGHSEINLEPGQTHETDDAAVIAAFEANPDISVAKKSSKESKR